MNKFLCLAILFALSTASAGSLRLPGSDITRNAGQSIPITVQASGFPTGSKAQVSLVDAKTWVSTPWLFDIPIVNGNNTIQIPIDWSFLEVGRYLIKVNVGKAQCTSTWIATIRSAVIWPYFGTVYPSGGIGWVTWVTGEWFLGDYIEVSLVNEDTGETYNLGFSDDPSSGRFQLNLPNVTGNHFRIHLNAIDLFQRQQEDPEDPDSGQSIITLEQSTQSSLVVLATPYTFSVTPGVEATGINNAGEIVGTVLGDHGFLFSRGNLTIFDVPDSIGTEALGINDAGDIVGRFFTSSQPATHGFVLSRGTFTILDPPGSLLGPPGGVTEGAEASGINNRGQIVGWFQGQTPITHEARAFLFSNGSFSALPAANAIEAFGINDAGQIVGQADGSHGFLDRRGTFTTIDFPGSDTTVVTGINNAGEIVGWYATGTEVHGFLISAGTFTTLDFPGDTFTQVFRPFTQVFGINQRGQIVGRFSDSTGEHGFVATPVR